MDFLPFQRRPTFSFLPPTGESKESSQALEEDKLITVSPVVNPAQFARRQDVGCRSTVITTVTFKSIVLTLALYEGKDGVLLLGGRQGLRGKQSSVETGCLKKPQNASHIGQ